MFLDSDKVVSLFQISFSFYLVGLLPASFERKSPVGPSTLF